MHVLAMVLAYHLDAGAYGNMFVRPRPVAAALFGAVSGVDAERLCVQNVTVATDTIRCESHRHLFFAIVGYSTQLIPVAPLQMLMP